MGQSRERHRLYMRSYRAAGHCTCGQCRSCREDRKFEAIFARNHRAVEDPPPMPLSCTLLEMAAWDVYDYDVQERRRRGVIRVDRG